MSPSGLPWWVWGIGAFASLFLAGLVAYGLYRFSLWLWQKIKNVWASLKAGGRYFMAWLARLFRALLPSPHSVMRALLVIAIVVAASLIAPQLTNAIGLALSLIDPRGCEVLRNSQTISVVAGASTAILFVFVRDRPLAFANRVLTRLSSRAGPGGGDTPEHVRFVSLRHAPPEGESKRWFVNIEHARRGVGEWMLVLPQSGHAKDRYTIELIEEQLKRVRTLVDEEDRKRRKNCRKEMLVVKWVCFVSGEGAFQAFQPYETFCFQVLVKHNARYAAILNSANEQDLAKAIQTEIDLTRKFKITDATGVEREALVPDAIPDLDRSWIRSGIANDEVLEIFTEEGKAKAMLVAGCGSSEPIGVLTAGDLAKLALYKPLTDTKTYRPHVAGAEKGKAYGDSPL